MIAGTLPNTSQAILLVRLTISFVLPPHIVSREEAEIGDFVNFEECFAHYQRLAQGIRPKMQEIFGGPTMYLCSFRIKNWGPGGSVP